MIKWAYDKKYDNIGNMNNKVKRMLDVVLFVNYWNEYLKSEKESIWKSDLVKWCESGGEILFFIECGSMNGWGDGINRKYYI